MKLIRIGNILTDRRRNQLVDGLIQIDGIMVDNQEELKMKQVLAKRIFFTLLFILLMVSFTMFACATSNEGNDSIEKWICPNCGNQTTIDFCNCCGTARPSNRILKPLHGISYFNETSA